MKTSRVFWEVFERLRNKKRMEDKVSLIDKIKLESVEFIRIYGYSEIAEKIGRPASSLRSSFNSKPDMKLKTILLYVEAFNELLDTDRLSIELFLISPDEINYLIKNNQLYNLTFPKTKEELIDTLEHNVLELLFENNYDTISEKEKTKALYKIFRTFPTKDNTFENKIENFSTKDLDKFSSYFNIHPWELVLIKNG